VDRALSEGADGTVKPSGEVSVLIEDGNVMGWRADARDGNEAHEDPVADEECCGDREQGAGALGNETDESGGEVAEGDAGEDTVDAEVGVVEVGEGGEEHLDCEDEEGTTEDVEGEGLLRVSPRDAGLKGEDDGGADEKEEVWEDEVGEGEAVPRGVIELGVGVGPVAWVVDEDHEGDGEAAQDIDGEDADWSCRGGR